MWCSPWWNLRGGMGIILCSNGGEASSVANQRRSFAGFFLGCEFQIPSVARWYWWRKGSLYYGVSHCLFLYFFLLFLLLSLVDRRSSIVARRWGRRRSSLLSCCFFVDTRETSLLGNTNIWVFQERKIYIFFGFCWCCCATPSEKNIGQPINETKIWVALKNLKKVWLENSLIATTFSRACYRSLVLWVQILFILSIGLFILSLTEWKYNHADFRKDPYG